MKKILCMIVISILVLSSCVKTLEDTTPTVSTTFATEKVSKNVVKAVPKIETEVTIKEEEKIAEIYEETNTLKNENKNEIEETENKEEKINISALGSDSQGPEQEIPSLDVGRYIYSNICDEKIRSQNAPESEKNVIDLNFWVYGMSPIEWVYIPPNIQLISNNKPNSSMNFGYKVNASSGEKGCYIPIFSRCDELGEDFDGRIYVYEDYTKVPVEEMTFSNNFSDLSYGGYNVKELLKKKYTITDVSKGVVLAGDILVNVVYVKELDEIIEGK